MALNQYAGDDGAVIGYRPDLKYDKSREVAVEIEKQQPDDNTNQSGKFIFSDVVTGFENNLPSKMLKDLKFVQDNIEKLLTKLPEYFISHGNGDYDSIAMLTALIASKNDEGINDFVDHHFNNIAGSIIPELMQNEYEALKRIQRLENRLKWLYYGPDSTEKPEKPVYEESDAAFMDKIHRYEEAGLSHKINYPALAFDSMLNRSISSYAFDVNKYAIIMSNIPKKITEYSKKGSKELVLNMFHEEVAALEARKKAFGINQTVEILDKTLYNYYKQREKLLNLHDLMNGTESVFLGRKIMDVHESIENAIKNVTRVMVGLSTHLKEMSSIEQEKFYWMNIYEGLSYNL